MPFDVFDGRYGAVLRVEMTAWEDVGGGKRGGGLYTMEEEDFIHRRY